MTSVPRDVRESKSEEGEAEHHLPSVPNSRMSVASPSNLHIRIHGLIILVYVDFLL